MKKYFNKITIGLIVVLFFIAGATVNADSISLLGKKVEKETTVKIVDKEIEAIIINGTTFISVRDAAEAFGYRINIEDDNIVLNKNDGISFGATKDDIPYIEFKKGENKSQIFQMQDKFQAGSNGDIILYPENELRLTPEKDLILAPYEGNIYVPNWSRIINKQTGESLQDVIDRLK